MSVWWDVKTDWEEITIYYTKLVCPKPGAGSSQSIWYGGGNMFPGSQTNFICRGAMNQTTPRRLLLADGSVCICSSTQSGWADRRVQLWTGSFFKLLFVEFWRKYQLLSILLDVFNLTTYYFFSIVYWGHPVTLENQYWNLEIVSYLANELLIHHSCSLPYEFSTISKSSRSLLSGVYSLLWEASCYLIYLKTALWQAMHQNNGTKCFVLW